MMTRMNDVARIGDAGLRQDQRRERHPEEFPHGLRHRRVIDVVSQNRQRVCHFVTEPIIAVGEVGRRGAAFDSGRRVRRFERGHITRGAVGDLDVSPFDLRVVDDPRLYPRDQTGQRINVVTACVASHQPSFNERRATAGHWVQHYLARTRIVADGIFDQWRRAFGGVSVQAMRRVKRVVFVEIQIGHETRP